MPTSRQEPQLGTPSADVFRLAHGRAIIGEYWSEKAGAGHPGRILHASVIDRALGLWLEFHPLVACYQRADLREEQVASWRLSAPFGPNLPIAYRFADDEHVHYPDYQGRWLDGTPFVADAGSSESLLSGQDLAAAVATRLAMQITGGRYIIGTEATIAPILHWNLINLHARRRHHNPDQFAELAAEIQPRWLCGRAVSIREISDAQAGDRWTPGEVQAAGWKIAADAAAAGRLLVIGGLGAVQLDLDTPMELQASELPPIIPDPLPEALETASTAVVPRPAPTVVGRPPVPGPTIDDSQLAMMPGFSTLSAGGQAAMLGTFRRNRAAMEAWQAGASYRQVADRFGMQSSQVHYLVRRTLKHGQHAWIPHGVYEAPIETGLRPEIQDCIRSLYGRSIRLGPRAVWESPELERVCQRVGAREPSFWQVYRYCKRLDATDPTIRVKRAGLASVPRGLTSMESFLTCVNAPGLVCQVDEHLWDGRFVGRNGHVIRGRMHIGVLACVATGAILAAVTSAQTLSEWDYMRLLKQAMEPKDHLKLIHGFTNDWDVVAKPQLILSDRGSIFISQHAMEVVCDRFQIFAERAPPRDPEAKGQVESIFTWLTRKVAHRVAGTTKSSPARLAEKYDSAAAAENAGITYEVFQDLLFQSIVDGYMREWDERRGGRRYQLWRDAVEQHGVSLFTGSPDDLILLLMKRVNRKDGSARRYVVHASNAISYKNRPYVCPGVFEPLVGKEVTLYVNEEDERVVYPFHEAAYLGTPAVCRDLTERASAWVLDHERVFHARERKVAATESRANRRASAGRIGRGRRTNRLRSQQQQATRETVLQDEENKRAELMTPRDRLFLRALESVRPGAFEKEPTDESDQVSDRTEEPFTPMQPPTVRFEASGGS